MQYVTKVIKAGMIKASSEAYLREYSIKICKYCYARCCKNMAYRDSYLPSLWLVFNTCNIEKSVSEYFLLTYSSKAHNHTVLVIPDHARTLGEDTRTQNKALFYFAQHVIKSWRCMRSVKIKTRWVTLLAD